jgi:hypothetical protein
MGRAIEGSKNRVLDGDRNYKLIGLNVRGRKENRLTSHPHVLAFSDGLRFLPVLAPSNARIRPPLGDGASRESTIVELTSEWGNLQCTERHRNIISIPI